MSFTPVQTLLGGYLLHLSTSSLLEETGRVFGISGIVDNALFGDRATWRWSTILGLMAGPILAKSLGDLEVDDGIAMWQGLSFGRIGLAGLLVGVGTKLGSGCTSGHFLCGVSRLSPRSLAATAAFFSTAMIVAYLFPAPKPYTTTKGYQVSPKTTLKLFAVLGGVIAAQKALRCLLLDYNRSASDPTEPNPASIPTSAEPSKLERESPYLLHGLTFSLGLIVSGMLSPLKVISFLQPFSPSFDPSLAMIVLAGVVPNTVHYFFRIERMKVIYSWEKWRVPDRRNINWSLIIGSILFGAGWGLAGVCPGPAMVGISYGLTTGQGAEKSGLWVGAMAGGMALTRAIPGSVGRRTPKTRPT